MKPNVNYIDAAKFETILTSRGLSCIPQAGFVKVSGAAGRNLYIARTKRVGRVDLSGFEVTADFGVRDLGGESFGKVKQQLRFDLTEDEVLSNFTRILEHMLTLPAVEKEKKEAKAKASSPKATGWSDSVAKPLSSLSGEEAAKRRALIEKVAAEKGLKVSKKVTDSSPVEAFTDLA